MTTQANERFLRLPDVLAMVGCSKSTWYDMVKKNQAPKQITISRKYYVWKCSDVQAWMSDKIIESTK
jgi:predicted DNA-binding transcriptional regulator AlpA